jgi:hypothetical protein
MRLKYESVRPESGVVGVFSRPRLFIWLIRDESILSGSSANPISAPAHHRDDEPYAHVTMINACADHTPRPGGSGLQSYNVTEIERDCYLPLQCFIMKQIVEHSKKKGARFGHTIYNRRPFGLNNSLRL